MITNYITIMFYDLCYYVLLPLACMTGAAGLYYIVDPQGAKNKAINFSWNATKFYITWSDHLGLFVDKYMPTDEESDNEDFDEDDNKLQKHYIFYNNNEHNSYITDEINDEIMEHVKDKIQPSIMFIRTKIGDYQYYKRTQKPSQKETEYDTLPEKLFIQVEFVTKDEAGKEKVLDIHSNLMGFYINGNQILDREFLEWYMEQFYNVGDIDDYELRIFDKDVNMLTVNSKQIVNIENGKYSIAEANLNTDTQTPDDTRDYEGATEE